MSRLFLVFVIIFSLLGGTSCRKSDEGAKVELVGSAWKGTITEPNGRYEISLIFDQEGELRIYTLLPDNKMKYEGAKVTRQGNTLRLQNPYTELWFIVSESSKHLILEYEPGLPTARRIEVKRVA